MRPPDLLEQGRSDGMRAAEDLVRTSIAPEPPKEHVVSRAYVSGWWAGYLTRTAEIARLRKAASAGVSRDPAMKGSGLV